MKKLVSIFVILLISFSAISQPLIQQIMTLEPQIPEEVMQREMRQPVGNIVRLGLFNHSRPVFEVFSGNSKKFAGTLEEKLYSRKMDSDEKSTLFPPDKNWQWDIEGAIWSPDGKHLLVKQINVEDVPTITLTSDSGTVIEKPYSRAGEKLPVHQYFIVNMESGEKIKISHNLSFPYIHTVAWNDDGKSLFMLQADRLLKQVDILKVDANTGEAGIIFSEKSDTYLIGLELLHGYDESLKQQNQILILNDEFIWNSERTGYNQLYLYSTEGELKRTLTNFEQNGIVDQVFRMDKKGDWVYFTASGNKNQPYQKQLFRASLKENKIETLVNNSHVFDAMWGESDDYFWVFVSSMPYDLKIEKYSDSGTFIETHWAADLQFAKDAGYHPEFVSVKLPDENTTIDAFVLKPIEFDASKKYPVVEYIYGGAFTTVIPRFQFEVAQWQLQDLANEGFVVVMIDSRGTPGRGKKFQDYIYGRMGQVEVADHAWVLEQLCAERPYMDFSRIGVMGHSWGGYFALKALIDRPDVYKAGHLSAPAVDPASFRIPVEIYMGCLPADCPEKYSVAAITPNVSKLKAPIQIIHGTADDDVPVSESKNLVKALESEGMNQFEFIEYPGMDHIVMRHPEWQQKMIEFFVQNLK